MFYVETRRTHQCFYAATHFIMSRRLHVILYYDAIHSIRWVILKANRYLTWPVLICLYHPLLSNSRRSQEGMQIRETLLEATSSALRQQISPHRWIFALLRSISRFARLIRVWAIQSVESHVHTTIAHDICSNSVTQSKMSIEFAEVGGMVDVPIHDRRSSHPLWSGIA